MADGASGGWYSSADYMNATFPPPAGGVTVIAHLCAVDRAAVAPGNNRAAAWVNTLFQRYGFRFAVQRRVIIP